MRDKKELKRILVSEDEPDIQLIMQIALEDIGGYTVQSCSTGLCVLEFMESFNPDLVLLDVMMPEMDGPSTLAQLRKEEKFNHIPIVFVTAKNQELEVKKYIQMGAVAVINKPFDPMTLAKKIQEIWEHADG